MSRSDWLKHPKAGLTASIITTVTALLIGLGVVAGGLTRDADYQREADNSSRNYAAYTEQQIRQSCLPLADPAKSNCIAEKRHAYREDQREERDLVAQRKSANWAFIMGAAAVLGMVLSAVGVVLVWITFRATKEANAISQDHQRARILASADFKILAYSDNKARVVIRGENAGYSTAYQCQCFSTVARAIPENFPDELVCGDKSAIKEADTADFTVVDIPTTGHFVMGRIQYHTIFGGPKFSYFCFEFEFSQLTRKWYAVNRPPPSWPSDT